jgi:carnitine-CoA ligase
VIVPAGPLEAAQVWDWCRGRMPGFAIPRFVRFADALPRTPSEKIRKAELRGQGITPGTSDRAASPRRAPAG